ncbi:uncharacterized protein PADG_03916 [Paracoccidioides brasiliensis Pb18]|uniref:Transcription factor domain-containing protein n=1 Tax=Paracoccidioides brasiliensis (strain Pb18) TaxID=502780 RepID=C1G9I0_PARBD|nr:uncharacterized protein PADG_03916 [Paracoccidioides brasiliensis Pb18]EEH47832.2 hypothetical protein PADG_03916 [Paracoccidioides brasiliensis Pb18]
MVLSGIRVEMGKEEGFPSLVHRAAIWSPSKYGIGKFSLVTLWLIIFRQKGIILDRRVANYDRPRTLAEKASSLSQVAEKTFDFPPLTSVSTANIETTSSSRAGTLSVYRDSRMVGEARAISRSVLRKSRLFGQSHWINGAKQFLRDLLDIVEPHIQHGSKASSSMKRCKLLAKATKAQWAPPWPPPPTSELPPKSVADILVACYLRTTETVYRTLHAPSFRKDYEAVWAAGLTPDTAFLVQLKLILEIGAATYDKQFSLRASAVRWVHETQTCISDPEFKTRLNLQSLQTNALLLIARQKAGDPYSEQQSILGCHRDPEALIPSHLVIFNDDQLMVGDALPVPDDTLDLRATFPIRLMITEFLNNFGSCGTYEETLRLGGSLRAVVYKELCQNLQRHISRAGLSPSRFQIQVVDFIMIRYMSALHVPFFIPALHETTYTFSHKIVIEMSLKIWRAVWPSSQLIPTPPHDNAILRLDEDDLVRLTISGSEFFGTATMQANLVAATTLMSQVQVESGLSPAPLRSDLLAAINDAKSWSPGCIEVGETNIKGHVLLCSAAARIRWTHQGTKEELIPGNTS